jgi:LysM repeat protein
LKKTFHITFLLFLIVVFSSFSQEKYVSHKIQVGETVYSIAKQYGISERTIYKLNPDAKNGLKTATLLILPITKINESKNPIIEFKKHKVKRKETLFSISQKYQVSIDDIKKYNKQLYSKPLKKKDILMIPIAIEEPIKTVADSLNITQTRVHLVLPKETKYGIARRYGITIAELEALNAEIGSNLQVGSQLIVPDEIVSEDAVLFDDENFEYYEVQPKEGFFRLKVKLGLTEEEIILLNPYAKDGLKNGMILKIPKADPLNTKDYEVIDLEDFIVNTKKKNLAILLPFKLSRIELDSLDVNKELLKTDQTLRVAIDFYSGVLMATEFAKDNGISTHLNIYDTEANTSKVSEIIKSNNFENIDAVIGPLLSKNIEKAAADLEDQNIPIFSPLSKLKIRQHPNLFQTLPDTKLMEKAMLDYIVENAPGKKIIVISGNKWTRRKGDIIKALPQAITIIPKEENYFKLEDIDTKTDKFLENWIILESDDPILVSNVIGLLNGLPEKILDENGKEIGENKIRLFTVNKNDAYDYNDVSNVHLSNLDFTFPSANKHYEYDKMNPFIVSYQNKYGVLPNKYAIRGFDVTYDILLRLASSETLFDTSSNPIRTEYIENKFQYVSRQMSGFKNTAFYIMKYNKALQLEVVE